MMRAACSGGVCAQHHVVDGEDQPSRIDDGARAEASRAEDLCRRMVFRNPRLDADV